VTAKSKVSSAETAYKELVKKFNSFHTAAGEFAAYAHTRPKVYSLDPDWQQADQWQKTLVQHSQDFNQQLKASADTLNDLSSFWQSNNLFRKQSVVAMADNLQADTENWRSSYAKLVGDFNVGQANFNLWQERRPSHWGPSIENALQPLQAMHKNLDEMSQLIQQIDRLKDEYYSEFAGSSEVTSLDPTWATWQKYETARDILRSKFVTASDRCAKYLARFNQVLQDSAIPAPTNAVGVDQKQSPQ